MPHDASWMVSTTWPAHQTQHRGAKRGRDIQTGMGPQLTITTTSKTVMTGVPLKDSDGKHTRLPAVISLS